jgi:hypothetical protein
MLTGDWGAASSRVCHRDEATLWSLGEVPVKNIAARRWWLTSVILAT